MGFYVIVSRIVQILNQQITAAGKANLFAAPRDALGIYVTHQPAGRARALNSCLKIAPWRWQHARIHTIVPTHRIQPATDIFTH